ncbi:MAG: AbrB/MazE/SpoVT family DNA-binding domain-containing protein [Candidatus Nanohaloarchaea archaeon]|nr:AbrB/MazE/SpoVT family DNA-binding domain-containing protein [Candidatus Nanohaloarchaea archaeon]
MSEGEVRKVGERGQVTIPKWLREKKELEGGDEVLVSEKDGSIVIEKKEDEDELKERLKEGYRATAERDRRINKEMSAASSEAWARIEENET